MKILTIAPTPFFSDRGCHIRIYEQMNEMQRRGHEVLIATYGIGRDLENIKVDRSFSLSKKELEYSFFRRILLDFFLFFHVLSVKRKFKPDVVHCYLHIGFLIGFVACGFSSKKIIFDSQGMLAQEMIEKRMVKNIFFVNLVRAIEKFIYKKAKVIFVSSETIMLDIEREYGVNKSHIRVAADVPARDIIESAEGGTPEMLRLLKNKFSLPEDKKILIFTGFMDNGSGVDILVKSFKILNDRHDTPPFFAVLIGYPEEVYEQNAREYGLSNVKFLGKTDYFKLKSYLAVADIAVAPKISGTEAHGKIINYLAAGLPVVCFDGVVNREIAQNFAIYAKEQSPESFAEALSHALVQLPELQLKKEERKKFVLERYSWRSVMDIIEAAYRSTLNSA